MNDEPKKLPWFLSVAIHTILAVVIIRTGFQYAFPEGEVSESISVETFGGPKGVQTKVKTPTQEVAEAPAAKEAPAQPEEAPAPKFVAPKPEPVAKKIPEKAKVTEPKVETQEDSPVVIPQKDEVAEEKPVPTPEIEKESVPEPTVKAEVPEAIPEPTIHADADTETEAPAPVVADAPSKNDSAENENAVVENPEATAQGSGPPPPFGTPGTTISEAALSEKPGNKKPNYPYLERLKRHEGTVVIGAYINKDGSVSQTRLVKTSGYPALDQECLQSYIKWKFKPGPTGWVVKPFTFRLK